MMVILKGKKREQPNEPEVEKVETHTHKLDKKPKVKKAEVTKPEVTKPEVKKPDVKKPIVPIPDKKPEVKPVIKKTDEFEPPTTCTQLKKPVLGIRRISNAVVTLRWFKIDAADTYQIEITSPGKGWAQVAVTRALQYVIERPLKNGVKYKVRVAAQNDCDMSFSRIMSVPADPNWKKTLPTADPDPFEPEIESSESEGVVENEEVYPVKEFGGDSEGNIKYSTVMVVRNIFEKLAQAAEESVASQHGDSVDVTLQVAAIFASSGEAAALTTQKLSQGIKLDSKSSLAANSKRISDQIWNPMKYALQGNKNYFAKE